MRLSLFFGTRARSRLPKKSFASLASWLVVAPLLALISVATTPTAASAVVATNPTPVCSGSTCTVTFTYTGDHYLWLVPSGITSLTIKAFAAQGGNSVGYASTPGMGAILQATVAVNPGDSLKVLVGGKGQSQRSSAGGGGGGGSSFVALNSTNTPLVVAGAGGGAGGRSGQNGKNGSTNTSGTTDSNGQGTPGTGGSGGAAGASPWSGGGGGGFNSGGSGGGNAPNSGGASLTGTAAGGSGASMYPADGGYGGGGGVAFAGGGGGGYSGGSGGFGGGEPYPGGGGGGSFVMSTATSVMTSDGSYAGLTTFNGSSVANLNGFQTGDGLVTITYQQWTLVYQTTNPVRDGSNNIVYTSGFGSGASDVAQTLMNQNRTFTKVRYRMEINYLGTLRYADVSFDKWSGATIQSLRIPDAGDQRTLQTNVSNLSIDSNWPGFSGVASNVTNGTGKQGRVEIWPWNYDTVLSGLTPQGSNFTFDYDDTPATSVFGHGSFQVHNLTDSQTVFAWNRHYTGGVAEIGFGNSTSTHSDWTFVQNNNFDRTTWKLQIYIDVPQTSNYTVTYNYNSATGGNTTASDTFTTGGTAITLPTPTRTGYTFAGWFSDVGLTTSIGAGGASYSPSASLTVYAKWNGNQYLYNQNTGTGTTASQTYAGSTLLAQSNGFTPPSGFSFNGWCTTQPAVGALCTGTRYTAGASLPIPATTTVTLFAIWDKVPDTPTIGTVTVVSASQVTIPFTAPSSNGGSAITSYTATSSPGGLTGTISQSGSGSITVSGLTSDTTYTFTVVATNAMGNSAASSASVAIKTPTVAPTISSIVISYDAATTSRVATVSASLASGQLNTWFYQLDIVSGSACFDPDGGAGTLSTSAGGGTLRITGLTNGCTYTLRLANWNGLASAYTSQNFSVNTFTVTYDGNSNTGGTLPTLQMQNSGTTVTAQSNSGTLVRSGFNFAGWNTAADGSGTSYAAGSGTFTLNADITLFARWTAGTYTVTYNANSSTSGTVPSNGTATYNSTFTVAANSGNLARTGYTFVGWNTAADGSGTNYPAGTGTFTFLDTAAKTLFAQWTPNTYTVTYNANSSTGGSVPANGTATYNSTFTVASNSGNLVRTGYTFAGWNTAADGSGTNYTAGTGSFTFLDTATRTLFARWTPNTYTVTYNANSATSGSVPAAQTQNYNTTITVPGNTGSLARTGYTFGGWNTAADGTGTNYSFAPGINVETYNCSSYGAQPPRPCVATPYSTTTATQIDFQWGSGAVMGTPYSERVEVKFSGFIMSPTTRTVTFLSDGDDGDYLDFDGVNVISNWVDKGSGSKRSASITLQANVYYPFTYWFYENGGGAWTRLSWNDGSGDVVIPAANFFASGSSGTFTLLNDLTLYAKWTGIANTVAFNSNSGSSVNSITWTTGTSLTLPAAPTRAGYIFAGWFDASTNGNLIGTAGATYFPANTSGFTLHAQWTVDTFTVTYNYNNATGGNTTASATFTTGGSPIVLPTPTRTGYAFGGWFSNSGLTTSIGAAGANFTTTASITAFAKWNGISNTVAYDAQGGATVSSVSWVTGASLTLPAAPARPGYTFNGWYDAATGGTRVGGASTSYSPANTAGFTLYAQWTANTNTVIFDAQGGSTVPSQSWTTATSLTLPAAPTRAGYTFNGWYAAASGGSPVAPMTTAANGLAFDGAGQITIPHSNAFNFSTNMTIEAWINTTATSERYIATKNEDSFYLGVNLPGGSGKVSFWLNNVSPGSGGWLHSAATVNDGNWHHVAATYDGSNMRIYVDGILSASRNVSSSIQAGSNAVIIGARGGGSRFIGSMYDVRFWNVARSASEISGSMNSTLTGSESGLVAHYSLNQGSAGATNTGVTTATSSTGTNDGALDGFALSGTASNWIQVRGGSSYNPTNTAGFTLYAQWTANTNTVTFDTLGGSAVANSTFLTGGSLTLPATPTLAGSTFVGWFLATSGGSALTSPYSPVATSNLTIYARWNTNRTITINSDSYQAGYARTGTAPTIAATPSAGVGIGTITYATSTSLVCTINASTGVVAFLNTGTCSVSATITETGGFTAATSPIVSFAIRATPGSPAGLAATPGNGQVTISWSAPANTGGGVTSYLVSASSGGGTCTWTSGPLSCTVTGLTNGTSYSFTVVAVNAQGSSAPSSSVTSTPRTVPGEPAITTVTTSSGFDIAALSNLYMRFKASDYNPATKVWSDSSGNARHINPATTQAPRTLSTANAPSLLNVAAGNGSSKSFAVVSGSTSSWIRFGNPASNGNYTLFTVARYSGASKGRIFTGNGGNYLSGFWSNNRAVAHYNSWLSGASSTAGTLTDWLMSTSYAQNYRANGSWRSGTGGDNQVYELCVNTCSYGGEVSDYQIADFIFFDRQLSLSEIQQVEDYLADLYGLAPYTVVNAGGNSPAARIAFTAPTITGGSTITNYTVTASNGATASGSSSPLTITGLSLGIPYTFTVTATNAAGTSVSSAPSTSITLRGSPGAPNAPTPTLTIGGVSLVWTAPSGNGGTISDYTIQYSANSGSTWTTFDDGLSPTTATTVRGLTNGTAYIFRVAAISEQGTGAFSSNSISFTPASLPDAPGKPSGSSDGASISITWSAASANGSPITNYIISYSSDSGNTWTTVARSASTATSATVSSLTAGMTYIFRVLAVNALGSSPNSELSNPIAVGTAPLPPTTLVATVDATTSTSAVLSWKKPSGGVGTVEAKSTIDATTFTAGLLGKRYVGYYNDNVNFFNTAPLFSGTGTPVNSTSIFNFSSNADFYSWQWTGYFKASVSGVYRFYLSSDDASHLWIGDVATSGYNVSNATVNNGGLHPTVTRTGSINLVAGTMYPIRLMFGENGGGDVVSLFWDLPNGTRITNGTGYLFQNPTGAVAAPVKGCAANVGNSGGVQISREGNNCVLKFTNPGVNSWTVPDGITTVDVVVVGGGGGAGFDAAGGGGGGAVVERLGQTVTAGSTFNVNVGAGGATSQSVGGQAQDGGTSTFGTLSAVGGGGGGSKNANGRGVIGAGGGGGGHANPGSGGGITLGGTPSTGADSFWGWSASNASMVNNQGSVAQFSYIQASLTRIIPLNITVTSNVTFNVSVDNSINNIIGWRGERIDTYSIRVELLNSGGTVVAQQSFNGTTKHNLLARTVTVPFAGAVASVRLTITGFDAGYWAGFYGPIFRSPSLLVDGAQFPAPGSITGFGGGGASGARRVGNGGGGGGAGGVGASSDTSAGGVGVLSAITNTYFGGGGAGGSWNSTGGTGGLGGGGNGGNGSGAICGNDGAPNTGGGGGAMGNAVCSNRVLGAGGSGVVIVRYAAANANVELPPPSDYLVQYSVDSPISWQTFNDGVSSAESATVTGLEPGKKYIFRVASMNGVGAGSFTAASNILEVRGAAAAPTVTAVTAGNQSAVVTFTAPTNVGGSPITRYTATAVASGTPALTDRTCTWNTGALTCTIGELVNGREYTVTVTATNAFGTSPASAGMTVTPKTTPAAPTALAVTSGNGQLSLAWSAPTITGGSVITGYRIERSTVAAPSWVVAIANTGSDATSATLTGLTNSTLYNIRVTALNVVGAGLASEVATGTPRGVPSTPTAPTGNGSAASAFITWSAPANNGAPITDYEIAFATSSAGPWTTFVDDATSATAATVTGLTNGTAHFFRIRATNSVGNGEWSPASAAITPATRPDAPTLSSVAPVVGQPGKLAITFSAGATGGSPITGYEFSINGGATWIALTGTSNLSISDLTNGVTYTVQIRAVNAQGASPASNSASGAPTAPADAPVVSGVVAGDSTLTISFSAPANNGGSGVTGYKYQIRGSSGTWSSSVEISGSPININTLNNAELYSVRVLAVNGGGDGTWSTIVQGTPFTTPSAPTISSITSGNGSLSIAYSASSNGSAVTAVEYSLDGGSNWVRSTATTSPFVITGLSNGTSYSPQIRLVNAAGVGATVNGAATIPFTTPFAPAITSVTTTTTSLTLNFTVNGGGNAVTNISHRIRSVAAPSNGTACAVAYATLNWSDNWSSWTEVAATNSLLFDNLLTSNCYDIQIKARNAAGYGGVSRESGKPIAPPSAPAIVSITPGAASLVVTFNESADNGGSAITAYEYRIGTGVWTSLATLPGFTLGSSTTFALTALTNGTAYSITLRAVNSAGAGAVSVAASGTPVTTPGAPTITAVAPLDGALQVTFTAPSSTGGSAILGYQYRLNSGSWITLPSSVSLTTFTISGLTNGTPYQVSLRASNSRGQGISHTFATNVGPGTAPDAPTISAVIVGSQQIALVVAPGLDGGYPLDNYAYSINDGAWVNLTGPPSSALANPIIITGLTNGTTYRFKIRTVNFIGESNASAEVNGTPATTASAPSIVSISTNDGSLSVAFTAPTSNGGASISNYDYSINGGTTWVRRISGANTSPLVITGLTNGVAYNVKIRAVNGIGAGAESTALVGIPQVPGAGRPISVTTTPLNGSVRIAWAPPAAYAGAPIVGYRVNATPGSGSCTWSSGEYNCEVSGLTNGTSYTFTVTSLRDDNGTLRDIDTSVASATTAPRTLPGAPTGVSALGGGNEAALSWSAPASTGGAAITDYRIEYSSDSGTTWSEYSDAISADVTTTVGGLLPGTRYIFRVAAINPAGVGTFSAATTATKTFEQAPELTLSLDQQTADGFSFILSFQDPILYTVAATTNNPSATVEQAGDFFTVRGLSPGASVTVTVTANRADYLQAVTTIFSSALMASAAPTVSAATSLDGGFRITVDNYTANTAAGISYAVTTTAGAVIDDGAGIYRVVGLANGESAIATVTSSQPGYVTRTTSVSGAALFLGVAAQIENIAGTRDGFTFTIANYSPEATYGITSSNSNAVISRVADLVTVTGLANLEVASLTVRTVRAGYMDASVDVIGVALPQSEVNTLSAISLSSGAVAFDPATYEYTINVANTVSSYRVTPTKSDVDSSITISINGGAATAIVSGAESAALPLNVGENTIVMAVTSQVGSVQNYTLYVKRAKSSVATLSALALSAGSITGFNSSLNSYETTVPYLSSSVTATATPSSSAATMRVKVNAGTFTTLTSAVASGALDLNVGNNLVVIEVTAEDGATSATYELTVTRSGAASSQLGSLTINVGTMATFNSATLNYEVIVPNGTTSAKVVPTLASTTTGSISVNGIDLADGTESQEISLTAGATTAITILVSASDGSSSTPYVISVKVDAPPTALAITRQSAGTQSGVVFTTQPQISINDAQNNRVLLNTSTVSVALTAGSGGALVGTTSVAAVRGLATFTNLGIRGVAGTTYTLTYSAGGLTVATQQITVTPGEAVALAFTAGGASNASGATFSIPLQVAAVDGDGNTVSTFGSAITIAVSGNGVLGGSTIRTPIGGVATFTDATLRGTAGSTYTITATSSGLTSATRSVTLTFGAPATLALSRATAGPVSAVAFTTQPELTIRDSAGNTVTNATGEVTVSIASGSGGTLGGTTTVALVDGVATFTDLVLSGTAGVAYTLAYSATGVTGATETLTLVAGAATRVQLVTPAAGFNNGTAFTRAQPVLRIQDSSGNTVTNSTASVVATVSLGGVLIGTTVQSASSGIVTFTNLGVFGTPGSAYTITYTSTGLTSATQTILLTSGSSLVPTFAVATPTFDGFTVQITNFSRIFNWTFSLLEGSQNAQISLGSAGLITVRGMEVGSSAIVSATTSRNGFENGAATVNGSSLLAPLRPTFGATTSTATGFRAQVSNFDSSYTWTISASNGGSALISSTGLITVTGLGAGVSSDVTVTTSKTGRVSASATLTGTASGAETTTSSQDISANLLTGATIYPICAGGSSTNEGIGNLNDRNSKSKYLCFNASSKLNASYIRNSAGFYTGDLGTKIVTGIQFTSGDSDRARDPIIYTLFGCNALNADCTPIVVNGRTGIDVLRNDTAPVQAFFNTSAFNYYKVTFGALRTSWTDAAQVAEIALIGVDANASARTPIFGAVTRTSNGFTVPITNFDSAFTWRASVDNNGGVAIGSDGVVTVTGVAGGATATVAVTTSRPKYDNGAASISGVALNAALIPTFGTATPTADGFTVPITNYSADYTWSTSVAAGTATIAGGVLTVAGQSSADQALVTVTTNRATYGTGRAQVVATALADGLTPNFGPSLGSADGFTIQVRNYSASYTWSVSASAGTATINSSGLITVTGLAAGTSSTVTVGTSKTGSFTVITQTVGKAPIGAALTPRFALTVSTTDGFTAQILNYDPAYTWSGTAGVGQNVSISGTGLVTVTGVTVGRVATATITASRSGFVTGSQTISGTAVTPAVQTVGGSDIQLQVPVSATTSTTEVIVTIDIPVDAAPGSTTFTGSAVATDTVDQGLRTVKIGGTNGGNVVTTVSTPIAITIPASAGIGVPVYSPDGINWIELPLLANPALPDGQEMGYYRYDDGTILILTRKIGE